VMGIDCRNRGGRDDVCRPMRLNCVLLVVMFFGASQGVFGAENLVVPIEAFELAKAHGCNQVANFFAERPAAEDPPYALFAGDGGRLQIAVWCTTDSVKGEHLYTLLLRIDDATNPLASCPPEIVGIRRIGGLRFINIAEDAKHYYFVGTQKRIPRTGLLRTKGGG
jgi:hypothetical protein